MYLDAVLDNDSKPVFNASPEEVKEYLRSHPELQSPEYMVVPGRSLKFVNIQDYLGK